MDIWQDMSENPLYLYTAISIIAGLGFLCVGLILPYSYWGETEEIDDPPSVKRLQMVKWAYVAGVTTCFLSMVALAIVALIVVLTGDRWQLFVGDILSLGLYYSILRLLLADQVTFVNVLEQIDKRKIVPTAS